MNTSIWINRVELMLNSFEGKTLEEKADIMREICKSHYDQGYKDGNIDGNFGSYHEISTEEYI